MNAERERNLLKQIMDDEEERLACYWLDNGYEYHCVIPKEPALEHLDIAACIEDTLHRLLDTKATDEEILYIIGAEKDLEPDIYQAPGYYIDLGYMTVGTIMGIVAE